MQPGRQLSEHAAKQLLRAYGIRVPREQLVTSAAAAVRAAGLVGYPVVMKASGGQIAHKTELGLVKIELTSASQVRDAYRELTDIARYEGVALDGVLVCQMVERGVEMVVGVTHDELFGPTVTVGLGGVLVEVLHDVAVRVPPFGEEQARDMLGDLRGRALLDGVRGRPAADLDALVEVVLRVQRMALELGDDLAELDINPLMVLPRGRARWRWTRWRCAGDGADLGAARTPRPRLAHHAQPARRSQRRHTRAAGTGHRAAVGRLGRPRRTGRGAHGDGAWFLRGGRSARRLGGTSEPGERVAGDVARMLRLGAQRLTAAVLDCEKPVIAAVNGTAAGLGAHLALACDLVLAADSAKFIEVFVRRGLVPTAGAPISSPG